MRNTLDIVILSYFTCFVGLASSKDYIFVGVVTSHSFESRFKSHARRACRTPEIDNHSRSIFDYLLNYGQTGDLVYFVVDWLLELLSWGNTTTSTKLVHKGCHIHPSCTSWHTRHASSHSRHLRLRLLTSNLKRLLCSFFVKKSI